MSEDGFVVLDSSFWSNSEPVLMGEDSALQEWLAGRDEFQKYVIFKTSGSSGVDKWIALSKEALEWSARNVNTYLKISPRDVLGLALPTRHVGGFGLAARAYFSGANLVEFGEAWSPDGFASWCRQESVTVTSLVPTQVSDLVRRESAAHESMRVVVVGGGALDEELQKRAIELGWPVLPSFGMTETSSQIATGAGLPLMHGWEAKIVEDRLALKGEGLLSWVIEKVAGEFRYIDPKNDGWFLTNDLAELDGRNLRILGRADRQVKILGELIDLDGVEKKWRDALGCPVAILKKKSERRGVTLWLLVQGEVRELGMINEKMPGLERLAGWAFLDRLPRSSLGKSIAVSWLRFMSNMIAQRGNQGLLRNS